MAKLHRADASASRSTAVGPRAPTVGRRLRAAALVAGLGLSLASAGEAAAQDAEDSTAITDAFTALLGGVGKDAEKDATKEGFSWAMSAMGIAGDDAAALATISAELQQIDADLKAIDNTLGQILDAIEDQTCNETQIAPSLQNAVNEVTELYNQYRVFVSNAAMTPPVPPSRSDVTTWQTDVLNNVPGDLNAINNGVYATASANVIHQCATSTADDWRKDNPD